MSFSWGGCPSVLRIGGWLHFVATRPLLGVEPSEACHAMLISCFVWGPRRGLQHVVMHDSHSQLPCPTPCHAASPSPCLPPSTPAAASLWRRRPEEAPRAVTLPARGKSRRAICQQQHYDPPSTWWAVPLGPLPGQPPSPATFPLAISLERTCLQFDTIQSTAISCPAFTLPA